MNNLILDNIIPFISKEERYNLFEIVDKLLEGNYIEKSKILNIKQSAYYQIKKKNLEISDSKTLHLLNLLHDKNQKGFNEFLAPVVLHAKKQISIIEDCLNSGLFDLDFSLVGKIFDIYQKYDTFWKDLNQKQSEWSRLKDKKLMKQFKLKKISLGMYEELYNELKNPENIGDIFTVADSQSWRSYFAFWRSVAKQVNFYDKLVLTKDKTPSGVWLENLFDRLREEFPTMSIDEFHKDRVIDRAFTAIVGGLNTDLEVRKRDDEEKLKEYRNKLRWEFNEKGHDLNEEQFEELLDYCAGLFQQKVPQKQGQQNIENRGIIGIVNLLRPKPKPKSEFDLTMMA